MVFDQRSSLYRGGSRLIVGAAFAMLWVGVTSPTGEVPDELEPLEILLYAPHPLAIDLASPADFVINLEKP